MPYPPQKQETYHMLGGINTKASQYITDESEFLGLQNVDFRTVGAMSSAAGSTQYSLVGSTSKINGLQDYVKQLQLGFTTVVVAGFTFSIPAYGTTTSIFAADSFNVSDIQGRTYAAFYQYAFPNNPAPTSFAFLNQQYGTNGQDFWTYPGGTFGSVFWQYGLGKPLSGGNGLAISATVIAGGFSGTVTAFYALIRKDGLQGPALAVTLNQFISGLPFNGQSTIIYVSPSGPNTQIGTKGLSFGSFGVSGIRAWVQYNDALYEWPSLLGMTTTPANAQRLTLISDPTAGILGFTTPAPNSPVDFLGTFLYGANSTQGSDSRQIATPTQPKVIESFFNQLFSAVGSRVFYSDIGTPEHIDYTNFFDVALDVSDDVSLMKTYFTQLVIAKPTRLYALSGSDPTTFNLQLVSTEYGCLSNRAACVWNQSFWFLDKKGIMEFNGANIVPVSNKVEDIFNRMNVTAAANEAVMIHVKEQNQVWCAIPIDGSVTNNIIVVYDYLAKAWTTRTPPSGALTALSVVARGFNKETPYYGTSNGLVGTYGASFVGDNGTNFTSIITSRFIEDMGESVTKMYRQLYTDVTVPSGTTYQIQVNLFTDHDLTTAKYATLMTISQYQNRIQFGIPGKSMAVQYVYAGASFIQINGFTLEYRFQRNS